MPIPLPPDRVSASPKPSTPSTPPRHYSPVAALLSYLVPGLGQIYQGRITKGVFFMISLYALFFGGMHLGDWRNVYLAKPRQGDGLLRKLPQIVTDLYNRPQFAGQFWIGVAAWPAIWQYREHPLPFADNHPAWSGFDKEPEEGDINAMQRDGDKTWDLGWVYTVIAGALNVLVIYDAFAGPAFAMTATSNQRVRSEGVAA